MSGGVVSEAGALVHGLGLQRGNSAQEVLDGAEALLGLSALAGLETVEGKRGAVQDEAEVVGRAVGGGVGEVRVGVQDGVEGGEGGVGRAGPDFS